jgi:hypothetical protein
MRTIVSLHRKTPIGLFKKFLAKIWSKNRKNTLFFSHPVKEKGKKE